MIVKVGNLGGGLSLVNIHNIDVADIYPAADPEVATAVIWSGNRRHEVVFNIATAEHWLGRYNVAHEPSESEDQVPDLRVALSE